MISSELLYYDSTSHERFALPSALNLAFSLIGLLVALNVIR